jgi:hypothetical protein
MRGRLFEENLGLLGRSTIFRKRRGGSQDGQGSTQERNSKGACSTADCSTFDCQEVAVSALPSSPKTLRSLFAFETVKPVRATEGTQAPVLAQVPYGAAARRPGDRSPGEPQAEQQSGGLYDM